MGMGNAAATNLTIPDTSTVRAPAWTDAHATFPPYSADRQDGLAWYCNVMAAARPCSNDAARFARGFAAAL